MNRHRELAQMMRQSAPAGGDDYVHLWRAIDIVYGTPSAPDSRGGYAAPILSSGYGEIVTVDGDEAYLGTNGVVSLELASLDIELRAGGDDYSFLIASYFIDGTTYALAANSGGMSCYYYEITGTHVRVRHNDNSFTWVVGMQAGINKRHLMVYTRSGATEQLHSVSNSNSKTYTAACASPVISSTTLRLCPGGTGGTNSTLDTGLYWAGIKNTVMTLADAEQAFLDWRPAA